MKDKVQRHSTNNPVYGLGIIGAAVFYISNASGFWAGVVGFLKAIVWPAFVVYELLSYLSLENV